MKTRFATLLTVLSMSISSLAMAQQRGPDDHGPNDHRPEDRAAQRGHPPERTRAPAPRPMAHDDRHDDRGAGPDHAFRRGGRLPPDYRSRQYVVDDWRAHHLNAPPRGYHWVQTGADYVLVAVATGIIAQVLLGGQ